MKVHIVIFAIAVMVGLGGGYLFDQKNPPAQTEKVEAVHADQANSPSAGEVEDAGAVPAEAEIFSSKNCLSCHAISDLGLKGGATGPDLSNAYEQVEGKHGKPINEFLKEPTSAVMSGVISGNPLTDEEINQIVNFLKQASEKE